MKLLTLTSLIAAIGMSSSVLAQDTVRLVFSHKVPVAGKSAASAISSKAPNGAAGCVKTPDGANQWCIDRKALQSITPVKQKASSANKKSAHAFQVVELQSHGYSAKQVAEVFNQDGRFGVVEADILVSTDPVKRASLDADYDTSSASIDEPAYANWQRYYLGSADASPAGSNITGLWDKVGLERVKNSDAPIDVIVVDTEFVSNDEAPYIGGRNFSTTALVKGGERQKPSDDFHPPAELANNGCDSHGLSVTSIIAAGIDNGTAMAGVTNNVRIHAAKSLTCGTGFLSDTANALLWSAGQSFDGDENVTPYDGGPAIINMSLAAGSVGCPHFMQEAIDTAVEAGHTVVVAAGNDSTDTTEFTPANCANVITVGSLARDGYMADYTNFGEHVDIMTQGTRIAVLCNEQPEACYGEGTSYSTPLVVGALAVVKRETGANDELLKASVSLTARTDTWDPQCDTGICGDGLLDAGAAFDFVTLSQAGKLNRIEFALAGKSECDQQWYLDYFGNQARLCELYNITFMGGYSRTGQTFQLVSIGKDENWDTATPQVEEIFTKASVQVDSLDIASRQYGVQVCESGTCGSIQTVNTELATEENRPVVCR